MRIRNTTAADLPGLKAIIAANDLFPPDMLDGMTAAYLGANAPGEMWLTAEDRVPLALAYCASERMTAGTWNLLLIAVAPDRQGQGLGTALVHHVEDRLRTGGARVLLVETSGLPDFARTRDFYGKLGYDEEARIREFYQAGEDKIVFRKALGAPPSSA